MRELIYLSAAKLRQFRPDRPTGRRLRVREVDAKAPLNLGEIRFSFPEEAAATVADLDCVVRYLTEESDRPLRWYTEDGLESGQWVQFETRMNYQVVKLDPADPDVLLFWELPETNPARLLLHGSPRHLLAAAGTEDLAPYHPVSAPQGFVELLRQVVANSVEHRRLSLNLVASLINAVNLLPPETASSVAGLARVTGVAHLEGDSRIIVASPLYVEYGH